MLSPRDWDRYEPKDLESLKGSSCYDHEEHEGSRLHPAQPTTRGDE
jgi:hypothetical protein